ncbi:hypothetical protein [Candidatus Reidiella endopervernicosa]|uniref:Uncharacterized protein n=1 Tax=Candidatus Reidiella endopervernicosa TaxID=2738883 RepID=A0A6N0HWF1_9GAMM|nr:hypothetical protein [Candidatus Reidiella endopervernicosa]QKQ26672.1 hypothetical protein HUE57_10570 [Candidatus Reidiella endopervernicosa]
MESEQSMGSDIYITDSDIAVSGIDEVITLSVVRDSEPMLPTTFGITCRYRPGCEYQERSSPMPAAHVMYTPAI